MQRYTIRKGDTLGAIAARFYGDAARFPLIVAANRISNPDRLVVGNELVIPDLGSATAAVAAPAPATPPPPAIGLSEQRLAGVHPVLRTRARAMIDLCSHEGVSVLVTQGLRTWEEQDALYAKGRTVAPIGKQHIVTNAKGGSSFHNFDLAFDIVILDAIGKADWDTTHPGWNKAAAMGKSVGLEWGGDWKTFKDLPHFQYTAGLSIQECRELHPQGLNAIWLKVK
jgi:hypothetical protein